MSNRSIDRAIPGLVSGAATLLLAWPAAHYLGITATIDSLMDQAEDARMAVLGLWYAAVFCAIATVMRVAAMLCGIGMIDTGGLFDRLGVWLTERIYAAGRFTYEVFDLAIFTPVKITAASFWKPFEDWLFEKINAFELDRELRAEYRRNFRKQYRTFAEFKSAYFGQFEKPAPKSAGMSAEEARALLGLSATFTDAELEAQHRKLMKKNHPDVGGTDGLAAKLNEARDTLTKTRSTKRKGGMR